ncbi:MAG: phosphoribosylaminoimidazolesuccinocarboxamide synthase, partial [Schleiferiaceae bacterium]|nr:phosphoribosylaminoimidazolesuccinocarboxamide synthase [Schleiferiaceae bacterium]
MLQLGQLDFYRGKVRDVYTLPNGLLAVVASDRLSAFDVVLDQPIPYKGQVLNQMAGHFLEATADIVPNWRLGSPHPLVTVGRKATPFKVEMVIRGYLSGHAWRTYAAGGRTLCGVALPEGLRESDALPEPIITPTTKAALGSHDEDISREAILEHGIVAEQDYLQLEAYTRALFARGQAMARERGLLLVDTKYEFGKLPDGTVVLIDEIHTPDSSRYFEADGYEARQAAGAPQQQLSKEFVRQWLIANGFQGQEGQAPPVLPESFIDEITSRYINLYERMTGTKFEKA